MTAASASAPALERRRERRVAVHLPLVIRGVDHAGSSFEERTFSEDLCRGGAAIITRLQLKPGYQLEIQIPTAASAARQDTDFSTQGRIVHVKGGNTAQENIVGVEFTGPRFNRMFE
jgi:c-di-GMP-binding flagellar brake protein YcgR